MGGVGADHQGRVVAAQRVSDDDTASVRSREDADGGPVAVLGAAQQVVDDVDVEVQLAQVLRPQGGRRAGQRRSHCLQPVVGTGGRRRRSRHRARRGTRSAGRRGHPQGPARCGRDAGAGSPGRRGRRSARGPGRCRRPQAGAGEVVGCLAEATVTLGADVVDEDVAGQAVSEGLRCVPVPRSLVGYAVEQRQVATGKLRNSLLQDLFGVGVSEASHVAQAARREPAPSGELGPQVGCKGRSMTRVPHPWPSCRATMCRPICQYRTTSSVFTARAACTMAVRTCALTCSCPC